MDVVSVCPLPVGSVVWQPRPSSWVLTFVCKATFALRPGESALAKDQEAPLAEDEHWNDDTSRSVRAPRDLLPVKPRPEVMLVGHAFAPGGAPARSVTVRLIVGEVDKSIEVFRDRLFTLDGALQEGASFKRMPLMYERAGGGPGTSNPVGVRNDARDAYGRRALPNLQAAGVHVTAADDFIEPIGFGPIAANWPSRAEKLGRYAESFAPDEWSRRPLPDGLDLGYFNQAPRDQQLAALRENERLMLENLHVEHARLVTSLPGLRPAAFVDRGRGAPQKLAMRADTLWIDTDRGIATMTWRGQLPLDRPDEVGRVVVGMESVVREVTWADLERAAGGSRGSSAGIRAVRREDMGGAVASGGARGSEDDQSGAQNAVETVTVVAGISSPVASALPFAPGQRGAEREERGAPLPGVGLPFQNPSAALDPLAAAWSPAPLPAPVIPPFDSSLSETAPDLPFTGKPAAPGMPPMVQTPPAPAVVPPPPVAVSRPVVDSPWASSSAGGSGAAREVIGAAGMAVGGVGAAMSAPSVEEGSRSGAVGASNAAAAASVPWSLPKRDLRVVPGVAEGQAVGLEPAQEMLQLLWFDPESMARVRRVPRWKRVLTELERTPLDKDLDEAGAGKEPWEVEDRREMRAVLAQGDTTDMRGVEEAPGNAIQKDGSFVAPLVLLSGDLELPFDELEAMKAAMSTAAPLITAADEGLKASVEIAKDFLRTPGLLAAPSVSEGLTTRIREAFAREKKGLPADYLDAQMERVLLAGRHYQKREVLGGTYLRFLLWLPGEQRALLGYLPVDLGKKLPMFRRFRARVIAEVHPVQDQYEAQGQALRVVAVARAGGVARG